MTLFDAICGYLTLFDAIWPQFDVIWPQFASKCRYLASICLKMPLFGLKMPLFGLNLTLFGLKMTLFGLKYTVFDPFPTCRIVTFLHFSEYEEFCTFFTFPNMKNSVLSVIIDVFTDTDVSSQSVGSLSWPYLAISLNTVIIDRFLQAILTRFFCQTVNNDWSI